MPTQTRFFKDITVKMTDQESAEAGRSLAAADYQVELIEEQKKGAMKEWATKIEAAELARKELRDKVRNGNKTIPVECRRFDNDKTFAVEIFRIDTEQLVDSRPMTTEERNRALNPTLPGVAATPLDDPQMSLDDMDVDDYLGEGDLEDKLDTQIDAADAFSRPAPRGLEPELDRDAFLAGGADDRAPLAGTDLEVPPGTRGKRGQRVKNFGDPDVADRPATTREDRAAGTADFADAFDEPVADVVVPPNAKARRERKKKSDGPNGSNDGSPEAA